MTKPDRPIRVQLSRKKGWRMPPNTVKVDRTTPFGNPFPIDRGRAQSVQAFREWFTSTKEGKALAKRAREDLRGKNLACWCPLDGPCHADTLLAAANLTEFK
jgi:hypothetical protein